MNGMWQKTVDNDNNILVNHNIRKLMTSVSFKLI